MREITKCIIQPAFLLLLFIICSGFGSGGSTIKKDNPQTLDESKKDITGLRDELAITRRNTQASTNILTTKNQKLIDITNSLIKQVDLDRQAFIKKSDDWLNWKNLLPSIIGALIGGLLTMISAVFTLNNQHDNDQRKAEAEEKKAIDSLLKSIYSEVDALWKQYLVGIEYWNGFKNWSKGEAIVGQLPISGNYFMVYKNSSHLIGGIREDNLRNDIIRFYLQAKGLMDTWEMNNFLNEKWSNQEVTYHVTSGGKSGDIQERLKRVRKALVDYAPSVIKYHKDTEMRVNGLLRALEHRYPDILNPAQS